MTREFWTALAARTALMGVLFAWWVGTPGGM